MKVRVGLAGLGAVAERIHLPACAMTPLIEVVAACDPDERRRCSMASKFSIPVTTATLAEMLDSVRPDLLIAGTPPALHFETCRQGLEAGVHVLCEKPFMLNLAEADLIIALAGEKRRLLRVNNQYRFMKFYAETRDHIVSGKFGRLFYIQCWQQMFHPPSQETNWRSKMDDYLLLEFGTHALDLVAFFMNALPLSVNAHIPRFQSDMNSDVLVQMTTRFPGERLATFSFNRVSHATERYFEMRLDCEDASIRISLGGVARFNVEWSRNAGHPIIKCGLLKGGESRVERGGTSKRISVASRPEFAAATARHLSQFVADMNQPSPSLSQARQAREILRIVSSAYESARTGETVWLQQRENGIAGASDFHNVVIR